MTWRVATVSVLIGMLAAPGASVAAEPPGTVSIKDARINESSGLVDRGSSWVTTNDSGDTARVFLLNPMSGKTRGITYFHNNVIDVEALAPAGGSSVWVGDIGDNHHERESVSVFRVRVGAGRIDVTAPRYRLVYPKGRPNAESLFVDGAGRLYVVTKSFGGGVVYRAPAQLSRARPNRLQVVGRVVEYATDAALTRDRRHVIVRGPEIAGVYTVPGFRRIGSFRLPPQPQGEGLSVDPSGRVRVSSEGAHTAVREVRVPWAIGKQIGPAPGSAPSPSATPSPAASPSPSESASGSPTATPAESPPRSTNGPSGDSSGSGSGIDPPWLMWSIPAVIALGALGIGLGLRRRTE